MKALDVVIIGGEVYDGQSTTAVMRTVGISAGKLEMIEAGAAVTARRVIDATGLVVAPGFIDVHGSSAWRHLLPGGDIPKLFQGVTTEVTGNCGSSEYPAWTNESRTVLRTESESYGIECTWDSLAGFSGGLQDRGIGVNILPLVGLNRLVPDLPSGRSRESIFADASVFLRSELRAGAWGLSSGLVYPPGMHCGHAELAKLLLTSGCTLHVVHLRNERDQLQAAVMEALEATPPNKARLLISHLKSAEEPNWGNIRQAIDRIISARQAGWEVTFSAYPYTAVSTKARTFLPPLYSSLELHALRSALQSESVKESAVGYMLRRGMAFDKIRLLNPRITQAEVPRASPAHAMSPRRLLEEIVRDPDLWLVYDCLSQDDVDRAMCTSWALVCSDSWSLPFNSPNVKGKPHPRTFGAITRFLKMYSIDRNDLSLGESVRRLTSVPAQFLRLSGRGALRTGYWADAIVFDPNDLADCATFEEPLLEARGMKYVFVNGEAMVDDGVLVAIRRSGRVLKMAPSTNVATRYA